MYDGFFRYGPSNRHLTQQDPGWGRPRGIGMLERPVIPDPFAALCTAWRAAEFGKPAGPLPGGWSSDWA